MPLHQGRADPAELLDADAQAQQDPVSALVTLISAPRDVGSIFGGMVDHALEACPASRRTNDLTAFMRAR